MTQFAKPIYLNVNPFCNDLQVIHVESTLGFNIMLYAEFECSNGKKSDEIEVNKITFYSYPMHGIAVFGILDVRVIKEPAHNYRFIEILMGMGTGDFEKEIDLSNNDIVWKFDEIVDNKISFDIEKHKQSRSALVANNPILEVIHRKYGKEIPVGGRPCQFRLVRGGTTN